VSRATQAKLAAYKALAPVPDWRTARTVIEELGRRGIEAELILHTGPAPYEAATQQQTAQADGEILNYWFRRTVPWGVLGAVTGFVLGLLVVAVLPGSHGATDYLTAALTGGAGVGLGVWLPAGIYSLQPAQPWELTFHETRQGTAYVSVHSERKEDIDMTEGVLRELGFTNLPRQDRAAVAQSRPHQLCERSIRPPVRLGSRHFPHLPGAGRV
jgi:hypothetical protein